MTALSCCRTALLLAWAFAALLQLQQSLNPESILVDARDGYRVCHLQFLQHIKVNDKKVARFSFHITSKSNLCSNYKKIWGPILGGNPDNYSREYERTVTDCEGVATFIGSLGSQYFTPLERQNFCLGKALNTIYIFDFDLEENVGRKVGYYEWDTNKKNVSGPMFGWA